MLNSVLASFFTRYTGAGWCRSDVSPPGVWSICLRVCVPEKHTGLYPKSRVVTNAFLLDNLNYSRGHFTGSHWSVLLLPFMGIPRGHKYARLSGIRHTRMQ